MKNLNGFKIGSGSGVAIASAIIAINNIAKIFMLILFGSKKEIFKKI